MLISILVILAFILCVIQAVGGSVPNINLGWVGVSLMILVEIIKLNLF